MAMMAIVCIRKINLARKHHERISGGIYGAFEDDLFNVGGNVLVYELLTSEYFVMNELLVHMPRLG